MDKIRNFQGRNFKKIRSEDKLSTKLRSLQMSKILSKGTKIELLVAELLRELTHKKFETNVLDVRGKPDFVFRKEKVSIFVDSDFWHGWQYPRWKHLLKDDAWREKIVNNRRRDVKVTNYLKRNGWKVLRIWEHQLENKKDVVCKIKHILR